MYTDYLSRLLQYLHSTKIYDKDGNALKSYNDAMQHLVNLFSNIKQERKQVFFIGNGGSAAIASHMTADFMEERINEEGGE